MKIIQAGILVCLLVIAGLLAAIYYNQRSQLPAEAPVALEATLEDPTAINRTLTPPEAPPVEAAAEVKPSPAPVRRTSPPKAQQAKSQPAPTPPPVAAPPDREPEPVREAVVTPAPPPVVRPEPAPQPPPPPEPRVVTMPDEGKLTLKAPRPLGYDENGRGVVVWRR